MKLWSRTLLFTPMLTDYILDGSIYQAPQLCNVFAARILMVKLKVLPLNLRSQDSIDFKEVKRVDHILASLPRKLPPPPYPEGYTRPTYEVEKDSENKQAAEAQVPVDPIINQGPAKRAMFNLIMLVAIKDSEPAFLLLALYNMLMIQAEGLKDQGTSVEGITLK